ncbi:MULTISPECIES: hypothetical protein [Protofrankia]|uniref:hypothetical protein n=1 Tax=Protofrankia TaxID=2994361 RepID=UPI0005B9183D|nr:MULTISPECIES: hypothetical protein [Protofrankia]
MRGEKILDVVEDTAHGVVIHVIEFSGRGTTNSRRFTYIDQSIINVRSTSLPAGAPVGFQAHSTGVLDG